MKRIIISFIALVIININTKAALITGTYSIPGGYNTITDAILDINFNGVGNGGVVFNIAAGYTETITGGLTLNTSTSIDINHSITFQKAGIGVNPKIIGSGGTGVSDAIITITGTSYVTFNGIDIGVSGTSVEFGYLIQNASATLGSQYDTIKNCKITLDKSNLNSIGVYQMPAFTPTSAAGTNSNNTYHNISVDNAYNGIYLLSQTTYRDQNCTFDSCMIGTASANSIGGNGTQATWGLRCDGANSVRVWGCEVCNIFMSGTKNIGGIFLSACTGACQVSGNKVHDISVTSTSTTAVPIGLRIEEPSGETASLYNNLVWGFAHGITTPTATMLCRAIAINTQSSYTGTVNVYFNTASVAMSAAPTNTVLSVGFGLAIVKNNIFSNTSTAGATSSRYCCYAATGTLNSSNYNDLYIPTGTNNFTGNYGSNKALLSDWRTATAMDANSTNVNPTFTSSTDLHTTLVALNNQGTTITGITTDYNGTTRSNPPDIGAYEFSLYANVKSGAAATNLTSIGATLTGNINANNEIATGQFEYGTTVSYGLTSASTPATVTGISYTPVSATITGLQPTTTYHFRLNATTSKGLINGDDQTFTTTTPTLTASTLPDFGIVCVNSTSGPNSFTITGTNLTTDNVTVAPLNGFTYSTTLGGVYSPSLSIVQAGSFSQTVYVKFNPIAAQSYNGNIVIGGGGATSYNVAASITGINPATIISSQATSTQSICVSGAFNPISVTATGTNVSYQWYSNTTASNTGGVSLGIANGAQTNTYSPQALANGTIYYYCTVNGTCGTDTTAISGGFNVYLTTQPTNLTLVANNTSITGTFSASSGADHYLIVRSTDNTLLTTPQNGTTYNTYDPLGGGIVLAYQTGTSISDSSLNPGIHYYYYVFAANSNCISGPSYLATPLTGSSTTTLPQVSKTLNVSAMLQEYYNGTGMNQTQGIDWNTGNLYNNFGDNIVDTLTIILRKTNISNLNNPCTIDTAFYGLNINVDGTIAPITLSSSLTGYHYIVVIHRNSIQTWSDSVDFTADIINYNFNTNISQFAMDGGMYINNNLAYIWGGDVNQNGNLESEDATEIYVAAISDNETINNGYVINDIDGNGNIDSQDYGLAYSNSLIGANIINPFSYQKKK